MERTANSGIEVGDRVRISVPILLGVIAFSGGEPVSTPRTSAGTGCAGKYIAGTAALGNLLSFAYLVFRAVNMLRLR
jgi:hypothetical protein